MAIVINGSGTVTGISVGGLPDDIVDAGMMADNSIDSDAYVDASIDNAHLADDAVGVAELSATGTASSSTFLRGDNAWAAAGGDNTPAFHAYHVNPAQIVSDNVYTKIEMNTESFDTDSAYDHATNYRFTVPVGAAGKYAIHASIVCSNQSDRMYTTNIAIYKNGASIRNSNWNFNGNVIDGMTLHCSSVDELAEADYIEIYGNLNANPTNSGYIYPTGTQFSMYKLIE